MDWQMLFFSTSGRINRGKYWLATVIYTAASILAFVIALFLATSLSESAPVILYVGGGLFFLLVTFSAMSVAIKRLHDRNKTGWWAIPFLVLPGLLQGGSQGLVSADTGFILAIAAAVLAVWGLIELGCLRGTAGPNSFGADPLEQQPT